MGLPPGGVNPGVNARPPRPSANALSGVEHRMRSGAEGIRTLDPLDANQVLSQLSYRPNDSSI